ncbi:MAG: HEPN domain-containing protein [Thermoleophilaceae bacterium]|jgi:uncharacterized protein (UPF0332 family)
MRGEWALPEERSRDELRAARVLLEADLPDQAVSRAYFAALHAASAALLVLGDPQTSEVGIVTAFARRVPDDGFDPEAGRMLRKLFEDRTDVDQALANAPAEEAERAIGDADRLVRSIAAWIEDRAASA